MEQNIIELPHETMFIICYNHKRTRHCGNCVNSAFGIDGPCPYGRFELLYQGHTDSVLRCKKYKRATVDSEQVKPPATVQDIE